MYRDLSYTYIFREHLKVEHYVTWLWSMTASRAGYVQLQAIISSKACATISCNIREP